MLFAVCCLLFSVCLRAVRLHAVCLRAVCHVLRGGAVHAQLEGKFESLGSLSKELSAVPAEYLPPATRDELAIAQHEFENITIVTECSRAVEQGCITGSASALALEAVQTAPLVAALRLARNLQVCALCACAHV
jgi:hypothetical protein